MSDASPLIGLARGAATRLGIPVVGVLGVLIQAKQRELIPAVGPVLDDLVRVAGFRIGRELYERVVEAAGEATSQESDPQTGSQE